MLGQSLLHYQITAKLGQGGMGEVYRATDTKLDREVAIKVLPLTLAQDKERLARFEREAKVLAQLSHPNVASVYGFEESEGTRFLVMEFVAGEDLSHRINRGAIPFNDVCEIGKQLTSALQAAHDQGVVHRDLKPSNIRLTRDGQVKVLDFGLAKAFEVGRDSVEPPAQRESPGQTESAVPTAQRSFAPPDDSPTITDAFTQPGTILGTAAYMSPEQARGRDVDRRTDIWAFGCVLFECLTGKKAFPGEDSTETLAGIIKGEPDWALLPDDLPPNVPLLLRKCLAKSRRDRLHDIADARIDLEQSSEALSGAWSGITPASKKRWTIPVSASIVVAILAATLAWTLKPSLSLPERPVRKVTIDLGAEGQLFYSAESIRLSRDGKVMAFLFTETESHGGSRLYLRHLDRLNSKPIQGARDARAFCFSPDGAWIAYYSYSDKKIYKVSLSGEESSVPLSTEPSGVSSMDWTEDGWILFNGGRREELRRIPEEGGQSESLFTHASNDERLSLPRSLPDGQGWLYSLTRKSDDESTSRIMLQKSPNTTPSLLIEDARSARFVPPGFIVFMRNEMLFAQRFDPATATLEGEAVRLGVMMDPQSFFDVADDGTLVFTQPGRQYGREELAWLNRQGSRQSILPTEHGIGHFALSSDGKKLAYIEVENLVDSKEKIWLYDTETENRRLLISHEGKKNNLLWSPNDRQVVFALAMEGSFDIYALAADGSRSIRPVIESSNDLMPYAWHPAERKLLYGERVPGEGTLQIQLRVATFSEDKPDDWILLEKEHYAEVRPRESGGASFSPDGNWIVYSSKEDGAGHLFIDRYPEPKGPQKITFEGLDSYNPQWLPDRHELVFLRRETKGSRLHHVYVANYRESDGAYQFDRRPQRWENGLVVRHVFSIEPNRQELLVRQFGSRLDHVVLFENVFSVVERKLYAR